MANKITWLPSGWASKVWGQKMSMHQVMVQLNSLEQKSHMQAGAKVLKQYVWLRDDFTPSSHIAPWGASFSWDEFEDADQGHILYDQDWLISPTAITQFWGGRLEGCRWLSRVSRVHELQAWAGQISLSYIYSVTQNQLGKTRGTIWGHTQMQKQAVSLGLHLESLVQILSYTNKAFFLRPGRQKSSG